MNALVQNHRRSFLTLLCLFCLHAAAWSQLKANFTATPTSGCSPLLVYFTDASTGNPTQWKWDLGNGVTSLLKNPSATYFNPGTYTVKLVVSNAAGRDSVVKTQAITVYESPTVAFSFDKKTGCFPLRVNFSDKSTAGSGAVSAWQWDFGDGTVSTQQNPSHTYTAAGTFNVTLRVTNSNGCVQSFTQPQAITIASGVKASFDFTDPGTCPAPATTQLTSTSTGSGPLQWQWDFGDGTTSNEQNPSHTYNSNGNYSVRLVVTSPQGCTDTVTKTDIFKIGSAKAGFNYPEAVCVNNGFQLTNTSSPTPVSVSWDFGDGTTSTAMYPDKVFTRAGKYTVTLVSNFGACSDTARKDITVSPKPVADFSIVKTDACRLPATVQLSATVTGDGFRYDWDFGDSTTGTTASPVHVYTKEGSYTIKLVITNTSGCSNEIVKEKAVRIQTPHLSVAGLPQKGCAPITITPTASVAPGETIHQWAWDFGDGTTSTTGNPTHSFHQTGTYDVRLIATTAAGCTDTVLFPRAVRVGTKPQANFVNTPTFVCPQQDVAFTDKSTGNVDQWLWEFGDGGTSTEQNPVHQYSDTGWQNVRLIVYNNTCPDTIALRNSVHVNPPIAGFLIQQNCTDKFTKKFVDQSLGAETWFWNFGDGTTSTEQNPVHHYSKTGTYAVKLTVTNGGCTHTSTKTVMVIDEKADLETKDFEVCRNSTANFSSTGINSNNIADWTWDFGDGSSSKDVQATSHAFSKTGIYSVALTITDLLGCTSTKTVQATVFGPTAAFTPSVSASCLKDNKISFNDGSSSDGQHPITKQIWSFGDGVIDSTATAPYQHTYSIAGSFTVSLTVEDNAGCRDNNTQTAAVVIAQPEAAFRASDTITCTGKAVSFTNESTAVSPVYAWSFGDNTGSTTANPTHGYAATGTYSIKLVITDQYGCKDSVLKKNLVTISYPQARFSVSDSIGTCPPLLVEFTSQSKDYTSLSWDFGDGNRSTLDTPSHFYVTPGTFYAKLLATGPGGCTDTMQKKIVIHGPSGTFSYEPLTGCEPLDVAFTATTKNTASFVWDFSDGSTVKTSTPAASHTYVSAGDYVPKLILTDAGGCSIPITGIDTIHVKTVAAQFNMNATTFCDEGSVQFANQTVSNDYITGYRWNFGDGSTSSEKNPLHHFTAPGVFTVQLEVATKAGCTDNMILSDTIRVHESPVVEIAGDSAGCAPVTAHFSGVVKRGDASQLKWTWNLANGGSSVLQNPPVQQYATDGAYLVQTTATDVHGCSGTAQKTLQVFPVPQTNAGADQWICRGSFYPLKATGAETYRWQAAPSLSCTDCDSPLAAPTDSTNYIVTGYNRFGCYRSDSVVLRVHQPFTLSVGQGDTICSGATVRLAASGADLYTWSPALSVTNSSAGNTTAMPKTSTRYVVEAKDRNNCFTDTASVYIKVWPLPTVDLSGAETISVGNSIALKPVYSNDVISYQWNNAQTLSCASCPTPVAQPKEETTYSVLVKNEGGCTARADVTVHVICSGGNVLIPNAFSPNGDGHNDRFYPKGNGISRIKSLNIFNRWGELVFSRANFAADNPSEGWDGTYKGQALSSDVFIYTLDVVCANSEVLSFKGDVTLLR